MNFSAIQARVNAGVLRTDLYPYLGDYINEALVDIQNRHSFACMKDTTQVTIPAGTTETSVTLPPNFKELQEDGLYYITPDGQYIPCRPSFERQQIREQWNTRYWFGWAGSWGWLPPYSIFYERYGFAPPVDVTQANGNLIPASAQYNAAGTYVLTGLLPGYSYTLTLGANEVSVTNGTATISASGMFVAQQDFITVNESASAISASLTVITASVVNVTSPAAGVTAVLGMSGNRTVNFSLRVDYYGYLPKLVNTTDTSPLLSAYPEMVASKAKAIAFGVINDWDARKGNLEIYEEQLTTAVRQDAYAESRGRVTHMG